MDNLAHALVGASIGEVAVPRIAPAAVRRVFVVTGVLAANGPDIDLLYTGLVEEPIGYLLHHRGHSHTLPGLLALAGVIWLALRLWPHARRVVAGERTRSIALIGAALLSHLLMDAANSYGTHLGYPFSSGWVYGDAVFVLEPWVWLLSGAALALSAGPMRWRASMWLLTAAPVAVLAAGGLVSTGVFAMLIISGGALTAVTWQWAPRRRVGLALVMTAALFVAMFGASRRAGAEMRRAVDAGGGDAVDVVVNPNPGAPWCWMVLTLERPREGRSDQLIARRGTLSLLPRMRPAASCASSRLAAAAGLNGRVASDGLIWHQDWRVDLERLRALDRDDCRVRAWLQFARVPYVTADRLEDLRFADPFGGGFGWMPIRPDASGCPRHLTNWNPPRGDVLGR